MAPFVELERGKIKRGESVITDGVIFLNIDDKRSLVFKSKNTEAEVKTIDKERTIEVLEKEMTMVSKKSVLIEKGKRKTLIEFHPNSDNLKKTA